LSRWEDVLHQQHLLWRFWISDAGERYQRGFVQDALRKGQPEKAETFSTLQAHQAALVFNAEPIFVDEEVQTVIDVASEQFEPEPFFPQDLITPVGFMLFPRPFYMVDSVGKRCAIRAFGWMPGRTGDHDGEITRDDWETLDAAAIASDWHGTGIELALYSHDDDRDDWSDEDPLPGDRGMAAALMPGMRLTLFHVNPILFGRSFDEQVTDGLSANSIAGPQAVWRYFQTAQRIARQRITTHSERQLPRQMRRQLARSGEERENVTVITLRRPKTKAEEERAVEWSCRWLVRGHWRNQFYASENTHRQIWISGYCKGPPDKELRVTKRAFEFVR
jgi:hypothetical protein